MPEWPDIPDLEPVKTKCVQLNPELWEDSQAMMAAALGIGPQTGKRSWEYILPPGKENHGT